MAHEKERTHSPVQKERVATHNFSFLAFLLPVRNLTMHTMPLHFNFYPPTLLSMDLSPPTPAVSQQGNLVYRQSSVPLFYHLSLSTDLGGPLTSHRSNKVASIFFFLCFFVSTLYSPSGLLFLLDILTLKQKSTTQQHYIFYCFLSVSQYLLLSDLSFLYPTPSHKISSAHLFNQMTSTQKDPDNNKRTMSRQHHRSLSTPSAGFYDIMEFFTGVSQNRGIAKVRRAHTTATTTPTLSTTGRRASLQSPMLCPHLVNVYKGQALPRPLRAISLLQDDLVDVVEEEERRGFLLTREQCAWGIDAVCSEICRRGNKKSRHHAKFTHHIS